MNITERLAEALRGLVYECETNMDFGTAHRGELEALCEANNALSTYDRLKTTTVARRRLDETGPYYESDRDFVLNNIEVCLELLEGTR